MRNPNVARVAKLLIAQVVFTLILSLVGVFFDWHVARDAFIGGFAASLGSGLFALWLFKQHSCDPKIIARQFYMGELLKLASIIVVFGLAMKKIDDINPVVLLVAFLVVQMLPMLLANKIAR